MRVPFLPLSQGADAVAAWREAGSPKEVVLPWSGEAGLASLQRLGRRATVWLEARPADAEEALDLAVAGAAHILLRWPQDRALVTRPGAELGDLLAVACRPEEADAVRAIAPDCAVAWLETDGLEVPDPPAAEPQTPAQTGEPQDPPSDAGADAEAPHG